MKKFISIWFFTLIFINNSSASGEFALVAGGSKGIGYAIAESLAQRGYNLVLIARNEDDLLIAQGKLEDAYKIKVEILTLDLSDTASSAYIGNWCMQRNLKLKMLCNVAGLGGAADFGSLPLDSLRYMIRLNLESAIALTYTLLPLLEKNAPSYILNVSSMAAFSPIPSKNLYSATKSALLYFSYALREQLKHKDVSVSCLAPGPVFTKPSIKEQTTKQLGWFGKQMAVEPDKVGEIAVRKTLKGSMLIVPGNLSRMTSIVLRILPPRWGAGIYNALDKDK